MGQVTMASSFEPQSTPEKTPASALSDLVHPARESKTYYGRRNADGSCDVWVVEDHTKLLTAEAVNESATRDLPLRLDLHNHSPTGFEWGYGGSRPAQLALALLADAVGDEIGQVHYQDFKRAVVSGLGVCWRITANEIRRLVAEQERGGLSTQL